MNDLVMRTNDAAKSSVVSQDMKLAETSLRKSLKTLNNTGSLKDMDEVYKSLNIKQ